MTGADLFVLGVGVALALAILAARAWCALDDDTGRRIPDLRPPGVARRCAGCGEPVDRPVGRWCSTACAADEDFHR